MRRTSAKIDRKEIFALPRSLPVVESVGLDDASIASIRDNTVLSKLQGTIRSDLRKATGVATAIDILRQFAIPWPMSTDILLRLTSLVHPAIRHPDKENRTFLAGSLETIVEPFRPAGRSPSLVARFTPSDPRVFNTFAHLVMSSAALVTEVSLIKQDPPGAKPRSSEHDSVFEWKWWRMDAYTWMARQSFGAKSYRAAAPMVPPADVEPISHFSPSIDPLADRVAAAWSLPECHRRHLMPRLFRDHDIELLVDSMDGASKPARHDGLF